jgi:hypothetical protein
MSDLSVTYNNILAPNDSVTGIRRDIGAEDIVLITGSHQASSGSGSNKPQGLLYRGPLYPTNSSGYVYLSPTFSGQTVTTSLFYGPNTSLFDPSLGAGNVRAVGSYKYEEGGNGDHSMMYQGSLDGSGIWTQIDVPEELAGGAVANTIAHSTMGDFVVGNYDLAGDPGSGNAFIYNIKSKAYNVLNIGPLATAYGIWQNGGDRSLYTICGGYKSGGGLNQGFLLDYDGKTGAISNLASYSYNDRPGIVTHFEGIADIAGGYAMAATTDSGAAYAVIARRADGSFDTAKWLAIADPASASISTGNSVLENNLIGIYTMPKSSNDQNGGIQSYVATVAGHLQG